MRFYLMMITSQITEFFVKRLSYGHHKPKLGYYCDITIVSLDLSSFGFYVYVTLTFVVIKFLERLTFFQYVKKTGDVPITICDEHVMRFIT